jgi:hypothetical protein
MSGSHLQHRGQVRELVQRLALPRRDLDRMAQARSVDRGRLDSLANTGLDESTPVATRTALEAVRAQAL